MLTFSDQNFEQEVLKSDQPVLVDFWAPWCQPCKMIAPIIEEVALEYKDRAKIGKLNIDDNLQTPSKYGIMAIPTLLFFKDGQIIDQVQGVVTRQQLMEKTKTNF